MYAFANNKVKVLVGDYVISNAIITAFPFELPYIRYAMLFELAQMCFIIVLPHAVSFVSAT